MQTVEQCFDGVTVDRPPLVLAIECPRKLSDDEFNRYSMNIQRLQETIFEQTGKRFPILLLENGDRLKVVEMPDVSATSKE